MRKGLLTIAFDDGYLDTFRSAIPCLDRKNLKCAFSVPAGLLGRFCEKRPVINSCDLKKLAERGHEIASHTLTHCNLAENARNAESELTLSKKILEETSGKKISSFVYPYISKVPDKKIDALVRKNYLSSRLSENFPVFNRLPVKDPFRIKGFCVMKRHSPEYLAGVMRQAVLSNTWLILVFHLVADKNTKSAYRNRPYRFFIKTGDFKKFVDYASSSDARIVTQGEAIKYYAAHKRT